MRNKLAFAVIASLMASMIGADASRADKAPRGSTVPIGTSGDSIYPGSNVPFGPDGGDDSKWPTDRTKAASNVPLEKSGFFRYDGLSFDLGAVGVASTTEGLEGERLAGASAGVTLERYRVNYSDVDFEDGTRERKRGPRKPGDKVASFSTTFGVHQKAAYRDRSDSVLVEVDSNLYNPRNHLYSHPLRAEATPRGATVALLNFGVAANLADGWTVVRATGGYQNYFNYKNKREHHGAAVRVGAESYVSDHVAMEGETELAAYQAGVRQLKAKGALRLSTDRDNHGGRVYYIEPSAVYERTRDPGLDDMSGPDSAWTATVNVGVVGAAR